MQASVQGFSQTGPAGIGRPGLSGSRKGRPSRSPKERERGREGPFRMKDFLRIMAQVTLLICYHAVWFLLGYFCKW